MTRTLFLFVLGLCVPSAASAETPTPIVGFRVEGDSKVTDETLEYLSRMEVGDLVTEAQRSELERALVSSELFKSVAVRYEPAPGGVVVVATLDDKHSWIVMPTLYVLSSTWAVGAGFAENNLFGENKKLLLYAQLGSINSFFVAAYVVPSFRGTKLTMRLDTYLQRKQYEEYANPTDDPQSTALARVSTHGFLNVGAALGWNFRWWLNSEARVRGARVTYRDAHVPDDRTMSLAVPSPNGLDLTAQLRTTVDRRHHHYGVTDGHYAQLSLELPMLGLTTYDYAAVSARVWLSWALWYEHEFELRTYGNVGYHLPFHDEFTLGAATDLRGYLSEQFRGDTRVLARAEYSIPIARWRSFSFRALGFADSGYIGFHFTDPTQRDYLPGHVGTGWFRNDVGGGLRIYFRNIVLPLLGLDVGYGIENRSPTLYFQVGLTDL